MTKSPEHWTSRSAAITIPRKRDDVTERAAVDDEVVLVDPRDGSAYHLNATALLVWHGGNGVTTTREIAEIVVERYEVDADDALDDVEQVVCFLAESGLLETEACA